MVEKFDEFLEEVEKDIRQEKLLNLWKQYGKLITGTAMTIVVLVVGYSLWGHYDQNKRIQMAEKLISAQEYIAKGETDKAQTLLTSLSAESHKTYQPLALFQKAGLLLQDGPNAKPGEALAIYNQLAEKPELDPLWRDLANLLAVMTSMDQADVNVDGLLGRLTALTNDQNPWRYFAREMKGILLHRKGEKAEATELFARLVQDNQTPPGISMRARLMVQIVSTGMAD
ncbi:MAG: hypothetical protein K0R76_1259 [Alphaproteobacteria bacterium]|jgi:hypothetical protein|nr:hypothetical protein [Alphaproteobacteria bacterium]